MALKLDGSISIRLILSTALCVETNTSQRYSRLLNIINVIVCPEGPTNHFTARYSLELASEHRAS